VETTALPCWLSSLDDSSDIAGVVMWGGEYVPNLQSSFNRQGTKRNKKCLVWKTGIDERKNVPADRQKLFCLLIDVACLPPLISMQTVEGVYIEYQSACPFVGIGSAGPRPLPRKRVCLSLLNSKGGRGAKLACE
jgi:hypothetical protein